ncbi:hypothetical protein QAD02_002339 [Eretmocerus hayati]|uniref:Uncharacterized protein n=1 Tax=Eretmocerus hayati TaxID=131215 RepID=A0ACC2NIM0_9HYME|nr:hypothetical protein QAD02_002339 [Eretmocerus hayati]
MEVIQQLAAFEFKDRMFASVIDLLCLCMFFAISPQVKEAALLNQRGDKKDVGLLHQFQSLVATLQHETITWLQTSATQIYGIGKMELLHAFHKIMMLESPEQYYKPDNFPPDTERAFYMRMVSEVPLLESTLIKLIVVGFSKENGITHQEMLELADQLIRRAAMSPTETFPLLRVDNIHIIELVFNLCTYQPPPSIHIPVGNVPPTPAISNLYWKS